MTTKSIRAALIAAALGATFVLGACKKTEAPAPPPSTAAVEPTASAAPAAAVTVTDLSVGKSVGADKKIASPTDTFAPRDTIFASVSTDGSAPSAVIAVKWTFGDGQTVKEDSKTIASTGPAATEFSIQKPAGWPKGDYKVQASVNGTPGPTKSFKVQ